MALALSITDGTTTINLNTGSIVTTDYAMQTPAVNEATFRNLGDGDTLSTGPWGNVTETVKLLITGASAAAVAASVESIEKMLDVARQNRLTWRGARVFLQAQYDHDSGVWRSEILAARLVHNHISDQVWRKKVETDLIITRRYFWEGTETQVQLSSAGTGTPTTGYVTVYNDDDATASTNWFQVAAAQVTGVIPAPLKLEVNNNSGATVSVRTLYVGNYVHMDGTTIDPILRGSEASVIDTSWTGAAEWEVYRWALPTALLDDTNGQYCRVLLALSNLPDSQTLVRARLQINFGGATYFDLAVGEQVKANGEAVLDLGALPLPPGGVAVGNTAMALSVTMQAPDSGGDDATVDWVQIMPAGSGLFRGLQLVSPGLGLGHTSSIIDDGIEGVQYVINGSSTYPMYRGIHAPVHVWPGVTNRFRLIKTGFSALGAGEAYRLKAFYRPRRLTI